MAWQCADESCEPGVALAVRCGAASSVRARLGFSSATASRALARFAAASTSAGSAAPTLPGLGRIARFGGRGLYGLFGLFGFGPLLSRLRLGRALSAPKPLQQEKSFPRARASLHRGAGVARCVVDEKTGCISVARRLAAGPRPAPQAAAGLSFVRLVLIARSRCESRAPGPGLDLQIASRDWPLVATRYSNHASASSISSSSCGSRFVAMADRCAGQISLSLKVSRLSAPHRLELRARPRDSETSLTKESPDDGQSPFVGVYLRRIAMACKPTASRFVTSAEPPTLTNGSGMPGDRAIPIVMPTLTNTWKRSANTIAPAAVAQNGSRAVAITRIPRQMSRR